MCAFLNFSTRSFFFKKKFLFEDAHENTRTLNMQNEHEVLTKRQWEKN